MTDDTLKAFWEAKDIRLVRVDAEGRVLEPPAMKVEYNPSTDVLTVYCPCGTVWARRGIRQASAEVPRAELMCGCGRGVEVDWRPQVDWVDLKTPQADATFAEWEEYLADMISRANAEAIGTFDEWAKRQLALRNQGTALADDVQEAIERVEPVKVQLMRKPGETDVEFRGRLIEGRENLQKALEEHNPAAFRKPTPENPGFDWFCEACLLGYYSPDVERSDADMNPLCRCGRVLSGAHEQPPGLRWVGDDDGE